MLHGLNCVGGNGVGATGVGGKGSTVGFIP
jgi:hypothetical protein